jgi:hypothetical protein
MGWNDLDRFAVRKVSDGFAQTVCLHRGGRDKRLDVELFFQYKQSMKSAYELAMERMGGGDDKPLTDEQKEQIAEIGSKYKAKIAERKIFLEKSVQDALAQGQQEEAEEARKILAQEVSSLESKAEAEKEKVRNS